jgi:hypothetical protein
MPKSGKTTVLDTVAHYLRRHGLQVAEFHGGGRYAPIDKAHLAELNIYLACEAVRYIVAVGLAQQTPRVHLMDRGVVDRVIFTEALGLLNRLSDQQREYLGRFLLLPEVVSRLDHVFVFVTSSELSMSRESSKRLTEKDGRVMNNPLLNELRTSADTVLSSSTLPVSVTRVDTQAMDGDERGTALMVMREVANELRQHGFSLPLPAGANGNSE